MMKLLLIYLHNCILIVGSRDCEGLKFVDVTLALGCFMIQFELEYHVVVWLCDSQILTKHE